MRVLHCILSMGGGGAERQLTYIAKGLAKRGCEVHVATFYGGPNLERLQASGATVHKLNCKHTDPRALLKLLKLISVVKPDIVQTWLLQMDLFGGLAAIFSRVPLVVTERCSAKYYTGGAKDFLRLAVGRRAAAIIANSAAGRAYWFNEIGDRTATTVINNIVPIDEIAIAPALDIHELEFPPQSELLLFTGRYYIKQKNLVNLLTALKEVLAKKGTAVAILFGEGPDKDELVGLVNRWKVGDRLKIAGFTANPWGWMKRARLFLSVSYYEGQPNTVLEAIACRCPVVVSKIPEHTEFLDAASAYFASPYSVDSIATAIFQALASPNDAKAKAKNAYLSLSRLSTDSISAQYIEEYRHILKRKQWSSEHSHRTVVN